MDHVEKDPHGSRFVVSVGIINRRRYEPKVQRLHRRRGALSGGVRLELTRSADPSIGLLLAGRGPPAEQQDEPPRPQHGSEKSSFVQTLTANSQPRSDHSLAGDGEGGRLVTVSAHLSCLVYPFRKFYGEHPPGNSRHR